MQCKLERVKYASTRGSRHMYDDDISTRFVNYVMVVRNFCVVSEASIPPRINGVLSSKKQDYEKYSHVKLSFEKIDECVKLLEEKYGYLSKEQTTACFVSVFIFMLMLHYGIISTNQLHS